MLMPSGKTSINMCPLNASLVYSTESIRVTNLRHFFLLDFLSSSNLCLTNFIVPQLPPSSNITREWLARTIVVFVLIGIELVPKFLGEILGIGTYSLEIVEVFGRDAL